VYLQLAEQRDGGRVVMVASATTADGKSTSAVELAKAMALAGERVILMDCDLRSPPIGRRLGLQDSVRMPDMEDPEAALQLLLTPVPDWPLWVAAVTEEPGSPWALEALVNRLPQLVRAARRRADFVVIDTPALGEVSDALPLLREVDDVIVVTRPGHTDRAAYGGMRDLMERMAAPVRGALVVGVANDGPAYRSQTPRRQGHGGALRTRLKSVIER